ncbi:MAG: hypothetical protein K6B52_07615 [Clostridiales bacterium]|nr:hypothetical protein [Clostridiales bacterium]
MARFNERRMPAGYVAMWAFIALSYAVWMIFFMKDIILSKYETVSARTVDGYTYQDITGMTGRHWLYPLWLVISLVSLLLFILYIRKLLYCEQLTKADTAFCAVGAVIGCVFVTAYGFLDAPNKAGEPAVLADKVKYITASMIGLVHPWLFRVWGVLGAASVFTNVIYTYKKYDYNSRLGVILGSVGSTAIYMTINCPSMGDDDKDFSIPRCAVHWAGALIFAAGLAAPLVLFLLNKARREKGRFIWACVVFCLILAVMIILLITVGKSAIIENIPMLATYILLFILNFTDFFAKVK